MFFVVSVEILGGRTVSGIADYASFGGDFGVCCWRIFLSIQSIQ